jgi:hypothetical protein
MSRIRTSGLPASGSSTNAHAARRIGITDEEQAGSGCCDAAYGPKGCGHCGNAATECGARAALPRIETTTAGVLLGRRSNGRGAALPLAATGPGRGWDETPRFVRHRLASLDFPMHLKATTALDHPGIRWFPREVPAYVPGVTDRGTQVHLAVIFGTTAAGSCP